MSEENLDLKKIDKEMTKAHGLEKAEDSRPIRIESKNGVDRDERERQIVDRLMGWFNKWEANRTPREEMWTQIYKHYFSISENYKTFTRSKITVPVIFQIIEAALPKLVNTIFSNENKFFDVVATNTEDAEAQLRAELIRRVLELQLDKSNFFVKFLDFTKQLLLYGTSYFKVHWCAEKDWVWERVPERQKASIFGFPLGETIKWTEEKKYTYTKRQPDVDVLDILDVYADPNARHEQDGKGVFIRSWIDKDEFKELAQGKYPVYGNLEKVELDSGSGESFTESRSERLAPRGISSARSKDQIELLEFWGKMDIDGDGIKEEAVIVIADRTVIVKAKANPFHHQKRPIVRSVLIPVPNEFYGLGLVEPVLSEVHELNTLRRQRLDNINQVLNAMWQADPTADVELDTLISAPNNVILSSPLDAVKRLETPDITANAFNEASVVQQDIERATTPASVQGAPDSGRLGRTARGAQLIIGQALEKFGMATKLLEEMALRPVLEQFYQLDLQFISSDDVLRNPRLYGPLVDLEITPEQLRTNFEFKLVGISELVGSEAEVNQIVSFMSIFGKVLAPETIEAMARKVWKIMGFVPDEIKLAMEAPPQGTEGVVDPNLSNAITGQSTNQGSASAPPSVPQP